MSSSAGGGRMTFSLIQEDENVDTELRLSTVNSRVSNSIPLPLFIQENYFPQPDHAQASETVTDDEINGADKTLSLFPRNSAGCIPVPVMRIPTPPLRWSRPYFFGASTGDETLSLGLPGSRSTTVTKRKRRKDENQRPLIPIERIPGLFQTLKSRGGSGPVFLFRKKLEDSDVQKGNHSVLVARGERVMEFLREEEAVNGGIKILGIDGGGEVYENMGLTKWAMLKLIVIKWGDWWRVVARNNAQAGDVVEIWGYTENQKPCLAFNFRSERDELSSAASTAAASQQ